MKPGIFWNEWKVSLGFAFMLLWVVLLVWLSACSLPLTATQAVAMTPEQIAAYKDKGFKVFLCLQGGGPPGAGGLTYMIVDKESTVDLQFSPNCQLIKGEVK